MKFETDFHFVFRPGSATLRPLLLLHGTGGNEHDLLDLADAVAPGRTLISPRGKVLEHGMPRFFKRLAEGVFDEADLRRRADELAGFVNGICTHHGVQAPVALGFSNGANIAAALLALHPGLLGGAVLLRAMAPLKDMPAFTLPQTPVLLVSGGQDPMIPLAQAERLAASLRQAGAALTHETLPTGHGLTQTDIGLMSRFLSAQE
ncbi:MAG: dienelactone hydrolase family protein [Rhizobiales bacterium]|nr:dienelactone hydrolase family protein [Hyphomicrobiales bacterium]